MPLDWWPSVPTTWDWTPSLHPGALLAAIAPAATILLLARLRGVPVPPRSRRLLLLATVILIATLDWPIGLLAQVTLSGRSMQYMFITLAAVPLLLLGTPRWSSEGRGLPRRILEGFASAPWVGALMLAAAAWLTHGEAVVDKFEADALGQAAIRGAWFVTAVLYWWPLVGPGPERERLPYLAALAYLVLPFVFPKFPAAVWVFSSDAIYDRFAELPAAAIPWDISPLGDQGLAGFILWLPGSAVVAAAIYLLLRHWLREDRRLGLRQRLGVPADPEAVAALVRPDVPELWNVVEALVRIIDEASPPRLGSDLAFARVQDRVILQLHVPAGEDDQAVLVRRIEAGYVAHLRQYSDERAEVIRRHLTVQVLPYGVRVT